ncbi:unnamed protein product [Moneuplotes crassus]|uniref:Glycylpeptide N-tetradecanoyltransferase n=2 Tax=Euplotes crassus TaxID=5936 RepID=A0AAD1UBA7_EUPCR|nr:unnamed protein product [Moneuplotes crassus]
MEPTEKESLNEPTAEGSSTTDTSAMPKDPSKDFSPENAKKMQELFAKMMKDNPETYKKFEEFKQMQPLLQPHAFWDTQPVQKVTETMGISEITPGPIEENKKNDISTEPIKLAEGFEWCKIDIHNEEQAKELHELLNKHYVESDGGTFKLDYPLDFLKWALCPPGYKPKWHIGVRATKTKKLCAFIAGIPLNLTIMGEEVKASSINFLCIHQKLRSKRLAPVLIKEVTRRINRTDVWQAIYTSATLIPKPFSDAVYYGRPLNYKKLVEVNFFKKDKSFNAKKKLYTLPDETETPGFRRIRKKEIKKVYPMLKEFLSEYKVAINFSPEEAVHYLNYRENVVYSYVVEDPETKEITDFISFYSLNSEVIGHDKHDTMNAAYCWYYCSTKTPLESLIKDATIMAKKEGFDIFQMLNIMENEEVVDELRFAKLKGTLHYYLFNYRLPNINPEDIGVSFV